MYGSRVNKESKDRGSVCHSTHMGGEDLAEVEHVLEALRRLLVPALYMGGWVSQPASRVT